MELVEGEGEPTEGRVEEEAAGEASGLEVVFLSEREGKRKKRRKRRKRRS